MLKRDKDVNATSAVRVFPKNMYVLKVAMVTVLGFDEKINVIKNHKIKSS